MKSEIDEDQRAALDHAPPGLEQRRQVGERRARQSRLAQQVVHEAEDLVAAAAGGDRALHLAAVEHRADAIAASGEQPGERRHEVDQHGPLHPLEVRGAEVHRRAEVEQEPGGDLAILDVLADVRRRPSGR